MTKILKIIFICFASLFIATFAGLFYLYKTILTKDFILNNIKERTQLAVDFADFEVTNWSLNPVIHISKLSIEETTIEEVILTPQIGDLIHEKKLSFASIEGSGLSLEFDIEATNAKSTGPKVSVEELEKILSHVQTFELRNLALTVKSSSFTEKVEFASIQIFNTEQKQTVSAVARYGQGLVFIDSQFEFDLGQLLFRNISLSGEALPVKLSQYHHLLGIKNTSDITLEKFELEASVKLTSGAVDVIVPSCKIESKLAKGEVSFLYSSQNNSFDFKAKNVATNLSVIDYIPISVLSAEINQSIHMFVKSAVTNHGMVHVFNKNTDKSDEIHLSIAVPIQKGRVHWLGKISDFTALSGNLLISDKGISLSDAKFKYDSIEVENSHIKCLYIDQGLDCPSIAMHSGKNSLAGTLTVKELSQDLHFKGEVNQFQILEAFASNLSKFDLSEFASGNFSGSCTYDIRLSQRPVPNTQVACKSDLVDLALKSIPHLTKETGTEKSFYAQFLVDDTSMNLSATFSDSLYLQFLHSFDQEKLGATASHRKLIPATLGTFLFDLEGIKGQIRQEDKWNYRADFDTVHLRIPKRLADPQENNNADTAELDTINDFLRAVPDLAFHVKSLKVDDRDFGEVGFELEPEKTQLNIKKLQIDLGAASLYNTSGAIYIHGAAPPQLLLKGELYFRDLGYALSQLKIYDSLQGLNGAAKFDLQWKLKDLSNPLDNLIGSADFAVKDGRILGVKNKFIDFLNLLTLKIFELNKEGAAVLNARGQIHLKSGVVTAKELTAEMDAFSIGAKGDYSLHDTSIHTDVTMRLKITKTINTIVLGTFNPLVALGYLALNDKSPEWISIDRLTEHSYKISGTTEKPNIEKISYSLLPIF